MNETSKIKPLMSSFLYGKSNASKLMAKFVTESTRIDTSSAQFDDVKYMVKRNQITSTLPSVLNNSNVILLTNVPSMPRAFKVFAYLDITNASNKNEIKVFIDVSDIIFMNGMRYSIKSTDVGILISYLVSAMSTLLYYGKPSTLINNTMLLSAGTNCYAKLFSNIIDYMRIGSVDNVREKCLYMSSLFYQINVLMKDNTESVTRRAIQLSGLTDRDADLIYTQMDSDCFDDFEKFIKTVSKVLKVPNLNCNTYIDKWIFLYGAGTQYALELYPHFSTMLTNAYVGAYLNHQKTIEKLVNRDLVDYTRTLFKIGSELI